MREAAFVKRNVQKWEEFEVLLQNRASADPDKLSDLFIQVTDDLAFARTQYPNSQTHVYLNALASKIHMHIYKNRGEDRSRFARFWKEEVPMVMFRQRSKLFYAFVIFTLAIVIGVVSQTADEDFVRSILGDNYVNMTLENIEEGDVLAVYAGEDEMDSFFGITFNNVRVSFIAFAFGIMISIGTFAVLFSNGIMVGCFFTFLAQQGFMAESFKVVMLHGTLELSAIVIAGAAGLAMGNGILFPGTYSRMDSFKKGALEGLKIIMGLVPVFIMAGFIEGFLTRYTSMPWALSLLIILSSAAFIIYYYIIYPKRIHLKHEHIHPA